MYIIERIMGALSGVFARNQSVGSPWVGYNTKICFGFVLFHCISSPATIALPKPPQTCIYRTPWAAGLGVMG